MSRNLLLDTQTPYAWSSSDTMSVSDISVPGKFVQTGSAAYSNAYFWIQDHTCIPDASRNLHKMDEWLTLSLDVKVSGRTAGRVFASYDLRTIYPNPQKDQTVVDISDRTEWTRISVPVKVDLVKNEAQIASLFVITCRDCNQGTTVEWRNMKLEVGDTGSDWTPAPEEVLFQKLEESDVEPGAISTGNTVVAGQTLENMKSSDSSWLTIRVRTKNIIPLLGNTAFYVNFPTNLQCFPIYFDSSDLSIAAPCDAHTTKDVFIAPQGAVGVELDFKKADNSEITPADVTNVTGGAEMATLARASIEIDNPSIGGRNLWPCSKEFLNKILSDRRVDLSPSYATGGGYKGFTSRKVTASSSSYLNLVKLSMSSGTFEYGDLFTLSFYAKGSGTFDCYFYGEPGYVKTAVVSCSPTSAYELNYYGDGCYRHTVPSAWTKFVVTWKLDTTGDLTKRKVVLFRALTGSTLEVCGIKFERGSKATDWTPAPEDVDSAISDLEDKTILNATSLEQRLSSQILQTQEQIQQTVTEQYFTKDETNKLIQQVSTAFTQTAEGWQMDFNKLVSVVNANQAATDSEFQEWTKYIRFVDGNIILGQVQNPVILTIKNNRISFAQSGQEVAYLSNAELVITDARVTHSLIIGKFGLVPRANGSMDLKKVSS